MGLGKFILEAFGVIGVGGGVTTEVWLGQGYSKE